MEPNTPDPRPGPNELPPKAAWLMAYLDGELPPEERARVEAWIAQDPDAHHQHEEERRRRELFAAAPVPEPPPPAWDAALAGIRATLSAPPSGRRSPRRPSTLWVVVGVAAAAVLAAVWLRMAGFFAPPPQPDGPPPPPVDMLAVATADDVTIDDMDPADSRLLVVGRVPAEVAGDLRVMRPFEVSTADEVSVQTMDGDDTEQLVVGEPPVRGALVMAEPGDVREVRIDPMRDKRQPMPYLLEPGGSGGMPMINVPLKTVRKD